MLTRLEPWQRTLWVMFFAQMTSAIGFSVIFPFLPLYVEDLGTNTGLSLEFWAGMVFSAQAITMMIASPFWGALADRYGRKLMMQRATFGGVVLIGMMAFVTSAEQLVLIRAIQGAITGTVSAANAMVASAAPRNRAGYAMGVTQMGLWSGVAIGPLIGGILADNFGYRLPFLVTSGLLFFAGILVTFFITEDFTPQAKTANKSRGMMIGWHHILSIKGVPQTYGINFLGGLSRSMIVPILPLYIAFLVTNGLSETALLPIPQLFGGILIGQGVSTMTGLIIGLGSATSTFSAVILGRMGDRIGHRRILITSALMAVLSYIPQPFVTEATQLLFLQGLTGLALGGLIAAPSALLAQYTEPGEEGAVYGLDNSVVSGARAVAPLLGAGIAAWFGLRAAFGSMMLVFGLIALMSLILLPGRVKLIPQEPDSSAALQPAGAD